MHTNWAEWQMGIGSVNTDANAITRLGRTGLVLGFKKYLKCSYIENSKNLTSNIYESKRTFCLSFNAKFIVMRRGRILVLLNIRKAK